MRTSARPRAMLVRERDRQRHQLRRLVGRVADHEPLVAGADPVEGSSSPGSCCTSKARVDAAGDVGRLLVERDDHGAGLGVEPVLGAGVADRRDPLAHEPRDVDVRAGRDLARDDHEPGRDERLAGDPPERIVGEHRVEHRVGDLVGDLVGMALGDRLGGEEKDRAAIAPTLAAQRRRRLLVGRRAGPSARRRARASGGPRAPSRRSR